MADRNQNHPMGPRRPQYGERHEERGNDERYFPGSDDDRDYDEGDSSVRAGSYDQGRSPSGRSAGRYEGYGDFGRGDYGGRRERGDFGQEPQGQRGYGGRGYGTSNYGSGRGRGYGYGGGGRETAGDRHEGEGRYGQGTFGTERGWNDPYGEDRPYTARGDDAGAGSHRGKGPKGYQRSDERLKEMLCERLRDDPEIDPSDVTITVSAGRVTLEGTVDSRQTKNRIEDVAEQFGVHEVQNNLRVQRGTPGAEAQGRYNPGASPALGGEEETQSRTRRN